MNILSLPLLVIDGILGDVGAAGDVAAPSDSVDPPHAAMIAVNIRAIETFKVGGLLGYIFNFLLKA